MDRRKFLRHSLTGSLAATLAPGMLMSSCQDNHKLNEIGLITNTIGDSIKKDHVKALEQVVEIGYKILEFGGPMGSSKKEFMQLLKRLNLRPIAGGTSMSPLLKQPEKHIEEHLSMNKKYLVCYWPWTTSTSNLTNDDCKKTAENLNKIGEKCNKAGIRFAFHNHDKEFSSTKEGDIPFDVLMQNTEPSLVTTELDLYWMVKGFQLFGNGKDENDVIAYFRKYPGRFELFHAKDMGNNVKERRDFACVGSGIIDFKKIFAESKTAGMKYTIVEHDDPENGIDCARTSYEYLSTLRF